LRPQLVVVSGLFRWESLSGWDFLGHNLLLSQASFFTMEFRLSQSLSHELSFFTMEFWLSRSLSHELFFSRWNSGYHEAFLTNFLFLRWNSGYHEAFLTNFLFSRWNSGYHEAFLTNFLFSRRNSRNARFGGGLFSYIYITKSIYIGPASLKTLPLDLEPPLQGKEYDPSYSNATRKSKTNFFPEITYRHVIRIFSFLEYILTKIEEKLLYATSSYSCGCYG
jgi:hypothetical protein